MRLSPRVLVYAEGEAAPVAGDGELVLAQVGSDAFGDGSHPTTRLCAAALDLLCRQRPGCAVLDVGTGTGVLARIARARGAARVAATDIDAAACAAASANVGLDADGIDIEVCDHPPDHWGARFDLVVANILEEVLRELAPALVAAMAPGATLLLSGFTRAQAPALRVTFEALGLECATPSVDDVWVLLMLRRR